MSRFIITLLAIIATTSAKPHIISYVPEYYGGHFAPSYSYSYPYYSYPYTPVTYVETIPVQTIVSGPPVVAPVPVVPAKIIAKNAASPPPPPKAAPPPPPAPPAPPAGAPAKLITITKTIDLPDLQGLLSALPIQQLLELPPIKKLAELKTSKLETISGLQNALAEKLAPIAALLP